MLKRQLYQFTKSRFCIFVLVGGSATALQYLIMFGLINLVNTSPVIASAIGYTTSAFLNYRLNAKFTFKVTGNHKHYLTRFLIVAISGLGINQLLLTIGLKLSLNVFTAQLITTTLVLIWNYLMNKNWAFIKNSYSR